jgi:AcrR family transcriptional regulator
VTAEGLQEAQSGRRERKKQRTREALVDAAFTLFAEKGFEATTVEEIADAVDVSSRTFFRYFASKEEVALTFQEEQLAALLEAFTARPTSEAVMTALGRAVVSVMGACERGELGFKAERFVCLQELLASSPALLAGSLEHAQKKQSGLTRVVAERMGVDPADDLRPHVVAAVAACATRSAAEMWQAGGSRYASLSEAAEAAFALLEESLNYPSAAPQE